MNSEELEEAIRMFLEFYNEKHSTLNNTQRKNMLAIAVDYLDKAFEYLELCNHPL